MVQAYFKKLSQGDIIGALNVKYFGIPSAVFLAVLFILWRRR